MLSPVASAAGCSAVSFTASGLAISMAMHSSSGVDVGSSLSSVVVSAFVAAMTSTTSAPDNSPLL